MFKFSSADGVIKVLQYKSIFVTSPLDLNNPFEMRPAWTQGHVDRYRDNENYRSQMMAGVPISPVTDDGEIHFSGTMADCYRNAGNRTNFTMKSLTNSTLLKRRLTVRKARSETFMKRCNGIQSLIAVES